MNARTLHAAAMLCVMAGCSATVPLAPDAAADGAADAPNGDVPAGPRDVPPQTVDVPVFDSAPPMDLPLAGDGPLPPDGAPVVDVPRADVPRPDVPVVDAGPPECLRTRALDLLLVVDNSNSMRDNQANLTRQLGVIADEMFNPPRDPVSGVPVRAPLASLHVGVVSTDLGTPGSTVPSCAVSDLGDDGRLNPVRNGGALHTHEPWTTAPAGVRPTRCAMDPNQYPTFLSFEDLAGASEAQRTALREDLVCNAYLSVGGCGLEQQLESAYRALVVHDPRVGSMSPNGGFLRDDAMLAILMLTDEEDGSVRDCRFAEAGVPCRDAVGVFDVTDHSWSSSDLNLRFYTYVPGSPQDPTWPLERYIDPANPSRGFTSLKPGHPERVVFAAIAGVPISPPTTAAGSLDWDALLGRSPLGADGYVAMSPEGPVSMRQANMDPSCPTRVVPACRREGSTYDPAHPACDTVAQYFASPSRRVAQVVRRFDERYGNGVLSSICRNDYSAAVQAMARRVDARYCAP